MRHTAQVDYTKGSPQNPMSDQEIVAKFRASAEGVVSKKRQDEIIAVSWAFDEIDDLNICVYWGASIVIETG